jgi:hypothetical protein
MMNLLQLRRYVALILAIIMVIPAMGNIVHAEASLVGIKTIAGTGYGAYF